MPEHQPHQDEADAERGHDKSGVSPAARREVKRSKGGEAGQADTLQHQAETFRQIWPMTR